jgi:hypothetical protein
MAIISCIIIIAFIFDYYYYCFLIIYIDAQKMCAVVCRWFLLLCTISQIATGVPYSESRRKKAQIAPILVKIGCNLTCFGPVQSFDVLILKKTGRVACP